MKFTWNLVFLLNINRIRRQLRWWRKFFKFNKWGKRKNQTTYWKILVLLNYETITLKSLQYFDIWNLKSINYLSYFILLLASVFCQNLMGWLQTRLMMNPFHMWLRRVFFFFLWLRCPLQISIKMTKNSLERFSP